MLFKKQNRTRKNFRTRKKAIIKCPGRIWHKARDSLSKCKTSKTKQWEIPLTRDVTSYSLELLTPKSAWNLQSWFLSAKQCPQLIFLKNKLEAGKGMLFPWTPEFRYFPCRAGEVLNALYAPRTSHRLWILPWSPAGSTARGDTDAAAQQLAIPQRLTCRSCSLRPLLQLTGNSRHIKWANFIFYQCWR